MTDITREQLVDLIKDTCPNCAASAPLRQRADTKEWVHDWPGKHAFCLASNIRNKYLDVFNG